MFLAAVLTGGRLNDKPRGTTWDATRNPKVGRRMIAQSCCKMPPGQFRIFGVRRSSPRLKIQLTLS